MTTIDWDAALALRVGRAVKTSREAQMPKLSAAKLAERTKELGHEVSKASISDLELGRKKSVSVAELTVLAAALRVPPLVLLYPDLPDGAVSVLPDIKSSSVAAAHWFSGEANLPDLDSALGASGVDGGILRIRLSRYYFRLKMAVMNGRRELMMARVDPQAGDPDITRKNLQASEEELSEVVEFMREQGWPVAGGGHKDG